LPYRESIRCFAALLPALAAVTATADLGVLHQYSSVALNPDGALVASVATVRQAYATTEQHGAVVIRSSDGMIRATVDPCEKCKYAGLSWSADGARLAFTASANGVATLYTVTASSTKGDPIVPNRVGC
jgi:hypothetical protein